MKQPPGALPSGCNLDSMLTVEQAAIWQQVPLATFRKRLASMPGVVRESRKFIRIHPRTYLQKRLKSA